MTRKIPAEVYSRVVGYFRPVEQWNNGKKAEWNDRRFYDANGAEEKREEVSVKKVYAGIGTIIIFAISLYGAVKIPEMIPQMLISLMGFVILLFGIKSSTLLIGKYIERGGNNGN